jgi:hypothetical protein
MKLSLLKTFFKTPHPYRYNFTARVFLSRFPKGEVAFQRLLRRPWISKQKKEPLDRTNLAHCFIGSIPHYRTGIGHILAEWNTGLIWSQKLGIPFAHCPLRDPWNDFFGLHGFEDLPTISSTKGLRRVLLPPIPDADNPTESALIINIINHFSKKGPCLFLLYFGQNSYRHHETSNVLRDKYFARRNADPMRNWRTRDKINVSVHVRRRNAEDMTNPSVHDPNGATYKARYRDSAFFIKTCRAIENVLRPDNLHFNIFSQGETKDFSDFKALKNSTLFLNKDVCETFHNVVLGDLLVLSPSSFSFKAGMISKGLKIAAEPWWHFIPDNQEWCRLQSEDLESENKIQSFLKIQTLPT